MKLSRETKKVLTTILTFIAIIVVSVSLVNFNNEPTPHFKVGYISGTSTVIIPMGYNGGHMEIAPKIAQMLMRYQGVDLPYISMPESSVNSEGNLWETMEISDGGILVEYDFRCVMKDPWHIDQRCTLRLELQSFGLADTVQVTRSMFPSPALGVLSPTSEDYRDKAISMAVSNLFEKVKMVAKGG